MEPGGGSQYYGNSESKVRGTMKMKSMSIDSMPVTGETPSKNAVEQYVSRTEKTYDNSASEDSNEEEEEADDLDLKGDIGMLKSASMNQKKRLE